MEKLDLKKSLPGYKAAKGKPTILTIPAMNFIQLSGKGDPNTSTAFPQAIEALFSVAYTLKFMVKKGATGTDYGVMPLEGLWWAPDMNDFITGKKDNWLWTAMIMQPEFITKELFEEAKAKAAAKKQQPALKNVEFISFEEGECAQVLHIGPYSTEAATIAMLHEYIDKQGYRLTGKHHEIYLSDFRKTAPEKLKTIVRQPIQAQ
jgi:hypothetical protein